MTRSQDLTRLSIIVLESIPEQLWVMMADLPESKVGKHNLDWTVSRNVCVKQ